MNGWGSSPHGGVPTGAPNVVGLDGGEWMIDLSVVATEVEGCSDPDRLTDFGTTRGDSNDRSPSLPSRGGRERRCVWRLRRSRSRLPLRRNRGWMSDCSESKVLSPMGTKCLARGPAVMTVSERTVTWTGIEPDRRTAWWRSWRVDEEYRRLSVCPSKADRCRPQRSPRRHRAERVGRRVRRQRTSGDGKEKTMVTFRNSTRR